MFFCGGGGSVWNFFFFEYFPRYRRHGNMIEKEKLNTVNLGARHFTSLKFLFLVDAESLCASSGYRKREKVTFRKKGRKK